VLVVILVGEKVHTLKVEAFTVEAVIVVVVILAGANVDTFKVEKFPVEA
jgi:hypothetical protein